MTVLLSSRKIVLWVMKVPYDVLIQSFIALAKIFLTFPCAMLLLCHPRRGCGGRRKQGTNLCFQFYSLERHVVQNTKQ
jgi:hypothetical protein